LLTNIAKIIWTAMPSDPEFTVKFTISADASAAGAKTIASNFLMLIITIKKLLK
jgi:hypothetical protein